jgi:hypothetical protein
MTTILKRIDTGRQKYKNTKMVLPSERIKLPPSEPKKKTRELRKVSNKRNVKQN